VLLLPLRSPQIVCFFVLYCDAVITGVISSHFSSCAVITAVSTSSQPLNLDRVLVLEPIPPELCINLEVAE